MTDNAYGSWTSPITAAHVAAGSRPIERARFLRSADDPNVSRAVVYSQKRTGSPFVGLFVTRGEFGDARELLPDELSVRSRVHEYGGGAWDLSAEGTVVFVDGASQRLYALTVPAAGEPGAPALIGEDSGDADVRYGDITAWGSVFTAVREVHTGLPAPRDIVRDIVLIDPGSSTVRCLTQEGPRFLAYPRLSPDGTRLAYIGWDHPHMPWDETQLFIQPLTPGREPAGEPLSIMGAEGGESILQPEWRSRSTLVVSTDASGLWELIGIDVDAYCESARGVPGARPAEPEPVLSADGEIGGPLWQLGQRWYLPVLGGNRILAAAGCDGLSTPTMAQLLWADGGGTPGRPFALDLDWVAPQDFCGETALVTAGGRHQLDGLYLLSISSSELTPLALTGELPVSPEFLPQPQVREFSGVHAVVYPPRNPHAPEPPAGTLPPCIAFVHGGPTAHVVPRVSLHHAYFTSRGIAVVDVNYRGSTGLGRSYRDSLRGRWGTVDVEDTVTVLTELAAEGAIDGRRLAISGGSAGGWTVLRALTTTDAFACGTTYFGVADLLGLARETHDFESRYIESLMGAPITDTEAYAAASPLNLLESLSVPVAIFQGELDRVVPPSQARALIDALTAADLPYAARFFPDEAHGFVNPEAIRVSLEDELSFYGRILGFATPDIPPVTLRGRGR